MKSVESDMVSLKSLLQSHLKKVVGDMDALQDAQERMAKDLLATKSSCKEELLSKLQTIQAAAHLHDTPALTPGASFLDTGAMETSGGRVPLHTDGQTSTL